MTKIALNYLAAVRGWDVALDPAFDDARNFARHGKSRVRVRVYPFENRHLLIRNGHYISLARTDDLIVAQVSLFMRTQFFVVLSDPAGSAAVKATAHVFDLDTRRLEEIDPLPLVPGRPLTRLASPSPP